MVGGEHLDELVVVTVRIAEGVELIGVVDLEDRRVRSEVARGPLALVDLVARRGLVGRGAGAADRDQRDERANGAQETSDRHGLVNCTP